MISLIYNDREINFSNNILKISELINTLYEDNNYDPILNLTSVNTIVNITDDVLHYFNLWFNELDKIGIVKYERENVIFKPSIFKDCDIKTLIDIFNFGFYFQIKLLCETVAYVLSKYDIIEHEGKYYIKDYEIHLSIGIMMINHMSDENQIEIQPHCLRRFINWDGIYVLEYFPNINEEYDVISPYYSKEIYNNEFEEKNIKKAIIPDCETNICEYAFGCYKSLEEVIIPYCETSIGEHAFERCERLTKVVIPNSVTSIGGFAFYGCYSLTEVDIPNSVTSIGKLAFDGCKSLTKVVIPNSVTSIGEGAFGGCESLTKVVIPNSIISINDCAFSGCKSLKEVIIPDSVTSIGKNAFWKCTSLKEIIIPDSVINIDEGAFFECESLTKVKKPNHVTIRAWTFYGCAFKK